MGRNALAGNGFGRTWAPLALARPAGVIAVWELGGVGLGLTAEVGHRPETRRLELFCGVVVVGVGLSPGLAVRGPNLLRSAGLATLGGPIAVTVAAVGLSLVLVTFRG